MKIAFTSDIHYDVTEGNKLLLPHLATEVAERRPDVFVIAGDVANSLANLGETLSAFDTLACRKLFVPGNHDLWVKSKNAVKKRKEDSWWRYRTGIPKVCHENGFGYLPRSPVVFDGVGFAGSTGWYDYSLRDPRLDNVFHFGDYVRGQFLDSRFNQGVWNDVRLCCWLKYPDSPDWRKRSFQDTTKEVSQVMMEEMDEEVAAILGNVGTLVVVLHTNPFAACIQRKEPADPFDAYEGSTRLGELLAGYSKKVCVHCICGHRHKPLDVRVDGVHVHRSPVGYLEGFDGQYRERAAASIGTLVV